MPPSHCSRVARRLFPVFWGLALAAGPYEGRLHAQTVSDEFRLKAAFLYRFPQFVEWPAETLEGRQTIDLCLLAPHPFGGVLQELVQGESLGGRPLAVRQVTANSTGGCLLLYIPEELSTRRSVLQAVRDRPILTVSDAEDFLEDGGIVQLRLVDRRVRFDIDTDAAARAGLRLSAQLLRLALNVRGGPP